MTGKVFDQYGQG